MSGENQKVKAELCPADFAECLVGGSAEQRARGRKIKRRAIVISVGLQSAGLAMLVVLPLLAKPSELVVPNAVPIPPYRHVATHPPATEQRSRRAEVRQNIFTQPLLMPATIGHVVDRAPDGPLDAPEIPGSIGAPGPGAGLRVADIRPQPIPPTEPQQKTRIFEANISSAMLIHRVEPVFPALARQIRRSGKVELRAVIGTDGTIQSLQVVSGDPLLVQSACHAVAQWRYKPTLLNGQPVEVDTLITVIYTLPQQ